MINQTRQQTKYCLGLSKKGNANNYNNNKEEESGIERMRKDVEANQDNALNLCTEKVLLAQQAYDLVIWQFFLDSSWGAPALLIPDHLIEKSG